MQDRNGKEARLSDYAGKVIVLNFWATWCSPCKLDVGWLNELERREAARGLAVIGIAMDQEGWPVIEPFLAEFGVNYRVLLGSQNTGELYGGVDVLPTFFLIDRSGRIADVHSGIINRKAFEQSVERLLSRGKTGRAAATSKSRVMRFAIGDKEGARPQKLSRGGYATSDSANCNSLAASNVEAFGPRMASPLPRGPATFSK